MNGRKWFVRGVVISVVGGCLLLCLLYQRWTNPAAVREQVMRKLAILFPGASITLDSARLRILGGIQIRELRLTRADDPEKSEIAYIPSGIIYHDKEKILDGELSIRKVELDRPRLRLLRLKNGKWNVEGLTGTQPTDSAPLPTILVHQGTLILEDRSETATSFLEVGAVNLSVINDPHPTVHIEGSAQSPAIGKLHLRGLLHRAPFDFQLTAEVNGLPLSDKLLKRLTPFCPTGSLAGLHVDGQARIEARLRGRGEPSPLWSYDLRATVQKTRITHPQLPLPLEDVSARLQFVNGELRVDDIKARSGKTTLHGKAESRLPCLEQDFQTELEIHHLEITDAICSRLTPKLQELVHHYSPQGSATLKIAVARQGTEWVPLKDRSPPTVTMIPEKASGLFHKFPYRVHDVTGVVSLNLLIDRAEFHLSAKAGGRPVQFKGYWQGEAQAADGKVYILAEGVPVDDNLLSALPDRTEKAVRKFHPSGLIDVQGLVTHTPGEKTSYTEFHIQFRHGSVRWDTFPYPLENVAGQIDYFPDKLEIRDFQGTHNGGRISVQARLTTPDHWERHLLALEMQGAEVQVDKDLHKALDPYPAIFQAWENFEPTGRMSFTAQVEHDSARNEDLDIHLDIKGPTVRPGFFPYVLTSLQGRFHYQRGRLEMTGLAARHNTTRLALEKGFVHMHPGGGYYTDLTNLQAQSLVADATLVQALPEKLSDFIQSIRCLDPVDFQTRLVVSRASEPGSPTEIFWDGQLALKNASLQVGIPFQEVTGLLAMRGLYSGRLVKDLRGNLLLETASLYRQPFRGVQARFQMKESAPAVLVADLKAPLFDGDISGQMRFELHTPLRYELNLTASQINLQKFGQHNLGPKSEISGLAGARLHLSGTDAGRETLDGNGSIDIPNGKLYNLPLLLDIIKFLGLRWPDRTAFEEFHAMFGITGNRVNLRRFDLYGNAISLTGKGEFNLDGTDLQLDCFPSWARFESLLPRAIRELPPAVSRSLLNIEVRGKITGDAKDLKFSKKLMPVVVDPVLQLRQRLMPQMEAKQ